MAACYSEQASSSSGNVTKKSPAAAAKPVCWQHRLFGKQLSRCSQVNQQDTKPCDTSSTLVDEDSRPACEVIGVYFSFINPGATCDDFTRQLLDLYTNVNSPSSSSSSSTHMENDRDAENSTRGRERRKKFEVVHVVLWSNVADVLDFEESFRAHVSELPWLAVPNLDYERKVNFWRFDKLLCFVPAALLSFSAFLQVLWNSLSPVLFQKSHSDAWVSVSSSITRADNFSKMKKKTHVSVKFETTISMVFHTSTTTAFPSRVHLVIFCEFDSPDGLRSTETSVYHLKFVYICLS